MSKTTVKNTTGVWGHFAEPPTLCAPLEEKLGRTFAGTRQNLGFLRGPMIGNDILSDKARGLRFAYRNANTEPWLWSEVIAGTYDAEITSLVDAVVAQRYWDSGHPFILSVHHEQMVDSEVQPTMGTPEEYPQMFARVYGLVSARKALVAQGGPIQLAFVPTINGFIKVDDPFFYGNILPNPAHFRFIGVDIYNKRKGPKNLMRFSDASPLDLVALAAKSLNKPWLIGEFGCDEDPSKAKWLELMYLKMIEQKCWGIFHTNKVMPTGEDFRPDSNPQALAVTKTYAHHPYFQKV